jgi:lysozyme family protein
MTQNFNVWWEFLRDAENFQEQLDKVKKGKEHTLFGFDKRWQPGMYQTLYNLAIVEGKVSEAEQCAKAYAKKLYWDVVGGDGLPHKYDIVLVDTAFHSWQHRDLHKHVMALKSQYNISDNLLWIVAITERLELIRAKSEFKNQGLGFDNRIVKLYKLLKTL